MNDPLLARIEKNARNDSDSELDFEEQPSNDQFPERQMGPQTGPKGVLADHAYYQREQRDGQAQERKLYNAKMLAKAPITTTYRDDEAAAARELVIQHPASEEEDSDDLLDEDDEEAIRRYREQRLGELKGASERERRVFGRLEEVAADDYATAIDKEGQAVRVVVHLYDERIAACRKLDEYLAGLAHKYALAKFIRVSAAALDFDLVGSPAVLGYQGGGLTANLVRFVDYVGGRFSEEAVEAALLKSKAVGEDDRYQRPVGGERE